MTAKTAARPSHAERRVAPRFSANPDASCRVIATDSGEFHPAELHNIATHGLRVVLKHRYDVGTPLVVELVGKNRLLERTLMVRVARVFDHGDGTYGLGCAFLTPLDGHELLTLVL